MPQPSYWPLVVALGICIIGYGLVYSYTVATVGTIIGVIGVYAWSFEPVNDPEDEDDAAH